MLNASVLAGEQVTVEDTGGRETFILANESVLMRGLVLRSWSNQISIRFRSDQGHNSGFVGLRYQGELLSCVGILLTLNLWIPNNKVSTIWSKKKKKNREKNSTYFNLMQTGNIMWIPQYLCPELRIHFKNSISESELFHLTVIMVHK